MLRSAILGWDEAVRGVFGEGRLERIAALTDLGPVGVLRETLDDHHDALAEVEVLFGTWQIPALSPEDLDRMPRLRALFYAASSVQRFARPLLARGVEIYSGYRANGRCVAEMTLGQILLAAKGWFQNARDARLGKEPWHEAFRGPGLFDLPVAILGAGAAGRAVIDLLRPFRCSLLVFDPFLTEADAAALGVTRVSLADAFARGRVVSNHLADKPETRGLLDGPRFADLPEKATFMNTGRPGTVNHEDLAEVFAARPDLTALLDVVETVAPETRARLDALPNVWITTHIAGTIGRERLALGDEAIRQFEIWQGGGVPEGRVTEAMLATMA